MQSPRANKGMFSRVSQGLGFGRPSKRLQRNSVPAVDSSGVRLPPVGGGSHMDEEDQFPAAQRDQPAGVQEGTEGFKAASSQPSAAVTSQPASSDLSEIQPASSNEDPSGQTVFAASYKNTAVSKLMGETKGPSTTIPSSENNQAVQAPVPQSQHPHATMAGHESTVSQTAPTTERLQTVPGFDNKSPAQGQNMNTGGFRSSSGVPSEDELAQLYSNEAEGSQDVTRGPGAQRRQAGAEGVDLPEDLQIGFSGKGSGIFGSFGTPARSARPTPQTEAAGSTQDLAPSMLQLPESEEFRSHHQPEGRAFREAAPVSTPHLQSTFGQYVTPTPQGSHAGGPESAQGVQSQPQMVPSGEGMPLSAEGQQQREAVPTENYQPHQVQQGVKSGGQGTEALAEGAQQYPATPDRFNRAPQPASPEDMQAVGSTSQGLRSATPGSRQFIPPQPVPEEEPSVGANRGVNDIPNYPRENPLFDEEQPQQAVQEEVAVAQPVFHDNPAYDGKSSGQASLGSPMIPNRSSTQAPATYNSSPHVPRQAQSHSGSEEPIEHSGPRSSLDVIDIPPEFDPSSVSAEQGGSDMPGQLTTPGQHPSETLASGPPAIAPQSANTAADQEAAHGSASDQPQFYSESRGIPRGEGVTRGAVTAEPQVYDNDAFEQEGRHGEQPYGDSSIMSGQREHQNEAVVAANAAVKQEVMNQRQPQTETETVSNAAEDGRAPVQQPFEQQQQQEIVPQSGSGPTQEAIAEAFAVQPPEASEETVVDEPAGGEYPTPPIGAGTDVEVEGQAKGSPANTQSMLVQEGDPPMGRPVIMSKEATLLAQPPSAAWGSAAGAGVAPYAQPRAVPGSNVQAGGVTGVTAHVPVEAPIQAVQSTVVAEAPVTDTVMVDQDPPIDPSAETAPRQEPALPVSTMTGQVTSTPQLGSPNPGVTQEITPAVAQAVAMTGEGVTSNGPSQVNNVEGSAPVAAPRPPPMTTQQIAAYRSGEDPDFDPVERRGWWEVDLTQGGGTILPSNTRGPSRATGRAESRLTAPTMAGPHIHPGGNPSQATHFGSTVPGGSRRQRGTAVGSGDRPMDQNEGSSGVYSTPPLAQGASVLEGGLTPTPTPVAPVGQGETSHSGRAVRPMTTQDVAAYRPAQDPRYDPTEGRPSASALPTALPSAGNDQIDNPLFEEQQQQDISGTAFDQVEILPGQKDVTHRGEQVGTPTFAPQQGPSTFGVAPLQPPQGRTRTRGRTTTQRSSTEDYSSRPILGGGGRRAARTVKLTDIGRPAQAPAAPKPFVPLSVQPKAEYEMGGADMLPQDSHYVKPTPYGQLGAHARSALSGAGWKTTWAMEMEDAQQQHALKYPVGPVEPKGASGYGPKAAPNTVGEPDYAALARGEPGFLTGSQTDPDVPSGSTAVANLPPSVTGATSGPGGEMAAQSRSMQMPPPPVHVGAPVTDRGFTGPGGAAGGARRRLAGKLFERQPSLQDPSFDPVSQHLGMDEGYGVDLPVHKPANLPSGRIPGRAPTGFGSEQGGAGGLGPAQGISASSLPGGVSPPQPAAPHVSGQEELGYAEGMGQKGTRLEGEEEIAPQEAIQGGVAEPADRSREVNERLMAQVRRRLQEAKSQLHTGVGAGAGAEGPDEADAGTPVDSPLGGRPKVLQGQASAGTPGQYWRTLEEVEAEGSNPVSRNAPSPWVQTRGPELAPRKLFQSGGSSSRAVPRMRNGTVPSGRAQHQGLENYGAGRVHNIGGGYPHRRPRGGNTYSWGRAGVF